MHTLSMAPILPADTLYAVYVLVFATAAVASVGAVTRARRIEHGGTRRGLVWLLLMSGGWATAHVAYLTMPTQGLQYAFYTAGLVIGWASVGPWLYFCSAYTGRSIHRNPTVRAAAVTVFLTITAIKVTNPLHEWYFSVEPATEPFSYLAVTPGVLHWVAMGLAYALAFVGFFMIFELFVSVNTDTRTLFGLFALTGLPVVLDVLGFSRPGILDLTYSPIGVALFAVGAFVHYFDRFQYVRVAGERDDPVVVVDEAGRIRDYNSRAATLLPSLADAIDEPLADRLPDLDDALDNDAIFEVDSPEGTRYYNPSSNPFATGTRGTGRSIVLSDVTQREDHQRELEEKNAKLEQFASMVSHDLRNPLQVAKGRTKLAIENESVAHLDPVVRAHDRMEQLIGEILTLAREGNTIDETEAVDIAGLARQSWEMVDSGSASLTVEDGLSATLDADPERLRQLFENLYRNAVEHGSNQVTITVGRLDDGAGFYVADDGPGVPPEDRETVFEAGYTTNTEGTGFGLAIVSEIVDGHEWAISVTDSTDGGARFEIRTG
jgi:signal transduction histidine kinase